MNHSGSEQIESAGRGITLFVLEAQRASGFSGSMIGYYRMETLGQSESKEPVRVQPAIGKCLIWTGPVFANDNLPRLIDASNAFYPFRVRPAGLRVNTASCSRIALTNQKEIGFHSAFCQYVFLVL